MIASVLESDRQVFICRELTKKFEELVSIRACEIASWIENNDLLKGEFIILVSGRQANADEAPERASLSRLAQALTPYLGSKEIATVLSGALDIPKKEVYQIALDAKQEGQ